MNVRPHNQVVLDVENAPDDHVGRHFGFDSRVTHLIRVLDSRSIERNIHLWRGAGFHLLRTHRQILALVSQPLDIR